MNIDEQIKLKVLIQSEEEKDRELAIDILKSLDVDAIIDGSVALSHAVNAESIDVANALIARKANLNVLHENGYPPLIAAIDKQNIQLINLLLENGADVTLKDQYGNDSLFRAVDTYNIEIVRAVVEAGANPFVGDNPENYSSFDSATDIGAEDIVEYFESIRKNFS